MSHNVIRNKHLLDKFMQENHLEYGKPFAIKVCI